MTHSPPPGAPRARIPAPRRVPPPRRRTRTVRRQRYRQAGVTLWALAAPAAYATGRAALPTTMLLAGFLILAAFALRGHKRDDRDPM